MGSRRKKNPRTGYYETLHNPSDASALNVVTVMVSKLVKRIRTMKHSQGMTVKQIVEQIPEMQEEEIYCIAFYKTLPTIDLEQSRSAMARDMYVFGWQRSVELVGRFGRKFTMVELQNIENMSEVYLALGTEE